MSGAIKAIILGAGTEIGKTHIACALLRCARARGLAARAVKPVMSGFSQDRLAESDAGRLAAACGDDPDADNLKRIFLYGFEEALAPNVAARRAGVVMEYAAIVAFARAGLAAGDGLTLVEGAGGVLSPLTDDRLNADLAADLALPAVLVTANYLGSVSHTLSALEACERRGISVKAVAISQPAPGFGDPDDLAGELARWTKTACVCFPFEVAPGPAAALLDLLSPEDRARPVP